MSHGDPVFRLNACMANTLSLNHLPSPLNFFKGLFIANLLINTIPSQGAPSSKNYINISLTFFLNSISDLALLQGLREGLVGNPTEL